MRKLTSFKDKTAVVTGASSGIGRALALRLAREGARVALVARRQDELESVAATIGELGGSATAIPCDVADHAAVEHAAARAIEELGRVDILVNNAGYGHHRPFVDWDVDDMERMMRVNYLGTLYWTKALVGSMVEGGGGTLVFVASVAGKIAPPEESAYAASKFAVVGLAEALAIELEDSGIDVLTVYPGVIRTPFFDDEALTRMPPVAKRSMVEPDALIDAVMSALAKGKHEVTYPRSIAAGYVVKALAPEFMRRQVRRNTIDALAKSRR